MKIRNKRLNVSSNTENGKNVLMIRIKGLWLEKLGYKKGDIVNLFATSKKIIIEKETK